MGTFYATSEFGVGTGTLAWKSTDGGMSCTALQSPNQLSQAAGGLGPGGGDTDVGIAPMPNASGVQNVYVASLSFANVTVSTSRDGGKTWSNSVLSATIPGDDREWIAAGQSAKVCVSCHDVATFNLDVDCSFDAGLAFTQLGSAIGPLHVFLIENNESGNLVIDPNSHNCTRCSPESRAHPKPRSRPTATRCGSASRRTTGGRSPTMPSA